MAKILIDTGASRKIQVLPAAGVVSVGFDEANDVVLDTEGVGAFHLHLSRDEEGDFCVETVRNSTMTVNGRKCSTYYLAHGDRVKVGNAVLTFIDPPPHGASQAMIEAIIENDGRPEGGLSRRGSRVLAAVLALAAIVAATGIFCHVYWSRRKKQAAIDYVSVTGAIDRGEYDKAAKTAAEILAHGKGHVFRREIDDALTFARAAGNAAKHGGSADRARAGLLDYVAKGTDRERTRIAYELLVRIEYRQASEKIAFYERKKGTDAGVLTDTAIGELRDRLRNAFEYAEKAERDFAALKKLEDRLSALAGGDTSSASDPRRGGQSDR